MKDILCTIIKRIHHFAGAGQHREGGLEDPLGVTAEGQLFDVALLALAGHSLHSNASGLEGDGRSHVAILGGTLSDEA